MLFLSVLGLFGDDVVIVVGVACVGVVIIDIHILLLLRLPLQPQDLCRLLLLRQMIIEVPNRLVLEFAEVKGLQKRNL